MVVFWQLRNVFPVARRLQRLIFNSVLPSRELEKFVYSTLSYSKKNYFLYSAVTSPQDRLRFTVFFPDRPVHSDTISAFLGSIQLYYN